MVQSSFGYRINKDQFYEVDPDKAPWVLEAFKLYGNGKSIKEIVTLLNTKGVTILEHKY